MTAGTHVWYRQARSGYGFARDVPAVFIRASASRYIVDLQLKDGTARRVAVMPQRVRPRLEGASR